MAAQLAALLVDDRPVGSGEPTPLEERSVVVAGKKAGFLAFPARCDCETRARRLGARLVLRLRTERETDVFELLRVEAREHVRLILVRVGCACEQAAASVFDDARVMTGDEALCSRTSRELEQPPEAEMAVAANAGIRRLATRICLHERIDDR